MSADLAFFTDFGSPHGKANEFGSTLTALEARGQARRSFVRGIVPQARDEARRRNIVAPIPGGALIPRALSGLGHASRNAFPTRLWAESVFDSFTAHALQESGGAILGVPRLERTFRKARSLGVVTVLYAAELHPDFNGRVLREESAKTGRDLMSTNGNWSKAVLDRSRKTIQFADYCIALTKFGAETFATNGFPRDRIFVCGLGVEASPKNPTPAPSERPLFVFVGNVFALKGIRVLLEAWRQANVRDADLAVVGAVAREMLPLISEYKAPNIRFVGQADPRPFYAKARAFLFPSLSEAFARVTTEAMAWSLPCVVSPVATCDLIEDGIEGFVVDPANIEEWSLRIQELAADAPLASSMGRAARRKVEGRTWQRFGANMAETLHLCTSPRGR